MTHPRGSASSSNPADKIVGIELLRFVSAFAVLVWHYQHFAYAAGTIAVSRSEQPFYSLLQPFYDHGALGVQVFWCISGFIFFVNYYESIAAGHSSFRAFAINRFSRLYPLHLLTLLIVAGLQPVYASLHGDFFVYPLNDLRHFVLNLLFISSWGPALGHSFNAPIWSVSVELIIYTLFYWLVSRFRVLVAYGAVGLLFLVLRKLGAPVIAQCLMYFFIGGAIALCRYMPLRIAFRGAALPKPFAVLGITLALGATATLLGPEAGFTAFGLPSIRQPVLIASVLFSFVWANRIFMPFANALSFLGNLTYGSYLCHFPLQLSLVLLAPYLGWTLNYRDPLLFIAFITATLAIAAWVFQRIERPAQAYLRARLLR